MAEKCTCGHEKKDHFEGVSVCLKSCDCILFCKRQTDG